MSNKVVGREGPGKVYVTAALLTVKDAEDEDEGDRQKALAFLRMRKNVIYDKE